MELISGSNYLPSKLGLWVIVKHKEKILYLVIKFDNT